MAYEGLIGKLGKDIFEGSGKGSSGVAKYMGTGAVIGGLSGATLSDDGVMAGAFRGAMFGALAGGGINVIPKGISSSFKTSGMKEWEKGLEKTLGEDASRIFRPTYDMVNNDTNKTLMKSFLPGAKEAHKISKNDKDFSLNVARNLARDMNKLSQNDLDIISSLATKAEKNTSDFSATSSFRKSSDWFNSNLKNYEKLEATDKIKVSSSFLGKAGFDSAYNHIVKPTGNFINKVKEGDFKNINKYEIGAAAFSGYGAYEAGSILNSASDGDISGVIGGMGLLVGSKLAYSQGVNLIHANSFLKEKGMTWSGIGKGGAGVHFARRFEKGTREWTPEDAATIQSLFKQ